MVLEVKVFVVSVVFVMSDRVMVAASIVDVRGVVMKFKFAVASLVVVVSGIFVVAASIINLGAVVEDASDRVVISKVVVVFVSIMVVLVQSFFELCIGSFFFLF